ncbi:hypothetical protein QE152_g39649 [Popillia japonica]|uniref:Uncharacterized protein n=1 Tax=Popillia japonica TaxID=7064 RepID=A0AAW1HTC2_POPJA
MRQSIRYNLGHHNGEVHTSTRSRARDAPSISGAYLNIRSKQWSEEAVAVGILPFDVTGGSMRRGMLARSGALCNANFKVGRWKTATTRILIFLFLVLS